MQVLPDLSEDEVSEKEKESSKMPKSEDKLEQDRKGNELKKMGNIRIYGSYNPDMKKSFKQRVSLRVSRSSLLNSIISKPRPTLA
mmetsp:Transcript_6167/g.9953  ORF Transcript_6167/g.9953 Transcript_6167/m.9953 type:complete len:85 (+) Transcript_6167:149-403(+)